MCDIYDILCQSPCLHFKQLSEWSKALKHCATKHCWLQSECAAANWLFQVVAEPSADLPVQAIDGYLATLTGIFECLLLGMKHGCKQSNDPDSTMWCVPDQYQPNGRDQGIDFCQICKSYGQQHDYLLLHKSTGPKCHLDSS